jgi:hypothetical protein
MVRAIKSFLVAEDGGAVEWLLCIIAGAIIVAVAFTKLKNAPGELGNSISNAGNSAANAIETQMKP